MGLREFPGGSLAPQNLPARPAPPAVDAVPVGRFALQERRRSLDGTSLATDGPPRSAQGWLEQRGYNPSATREEFH